MPKHDKISMSVIRRLPRYYRFISELADSGEKRISSSRLAELMNVTASQIRQDFNCFGGFGQQGYGYNVPELYTKIGKILCVDAGVKTILIGAGNLGKAVASKIFTRQSGFKLVGIFDKNEAISGKIIQGSPVRHTNYLENFCIDNQPVCAVICIPSNDMKELTDMLCRLGIKSFWNFSNFDIAMAHPEVLVENVHLTDSLMTLSFLTSSSKEELEKISSAE